LIVATGALPISAPPGAVDAAVLAFIRDPGDTRHIGGKAVRARKHSKDVEGGGEKEREEGSWAGEVAQLETETDEILAGQHERDMARHQQKLQSLQLSAPPSPAIPQKSRSPVFERFAFFTRGRKTNGKSLTPTSSTGGSLGSSFSSTVISPTSSMGVSVDVGNTQINDKSEPTAMPRRFIQPGGRGVVPQMDAPRGASNGAERVSLWQKKVW
jgi:hypothetical protein